MIGFWCTTTEGVEVWDDIGWCAATKDVEVQNDKGKHKLPFFEPLIVLCIPMKIRKMGRCYCKLV